MKALWVACAATFGAAAAVAGVVVSPWLDVDEVTIFGLHRVSVAEAADAVGFGPGRPMIAVNTGAAQAALLDISWVATASVERDWPATVRVTLTERQPVAVALAGPRRWVMVDVDARVLGEPMDDEAVDAAMLPRISGIRAAGPAGSFLDDDATAPLAALAGLTEGVRGVAAAPLAPDEVYAVWRDERDGLLVDTTFGVRLVLGDDAQLRSKVIAVSAVLDYRRASAPDVGPASGRVSPAPTTLLDVSVPHLPVERALR